MDPDHEVTAAAERTELLPQTQSRRTLLRRMSLAGVGFVLMLVLTACGGGEDEDDDQEEREEDGEEQEEEDV